ncbi:hypothetical protein BDD12DRAFT_846480 [Trichophaea hybrida]|nr:hypothetical protein BDD12DRAFT_846480 [Trichophaea hybrida]
MKFTLSTAAIILCAIAGLASAAPAPEPMADAIPEPVADAFAAADAVPETLKPRSCGGPVKGYCNGGNKCWNYCYRSCGSQHGYCGWNNGYNWCYCPSW